MKKCCLHRPWFDRSVFFPTFFFLHCSGRVTFCSEWLVTSKPFWLSPLSCPAPWRHCCPLSSRSAVTLPGRRSLGCCSWDVDTVLWRWRPLYCWTQFLQRKNTNKIHLNICQNWKNNHAEGEKYVYIKKCSLCAPCWSKIKSAMGFIFFLTKELPGVSVHHGAPTGPCLYCTCCLKHDRLVFQADSFWEDATGQGWTAVPTDPAESHHNDRISCIQGKCLCLIIDFILKLLKVFVKPKMSQNLGKNSLPSEGPKPLQTILLTEPQPNHRVTSRWWKTEHQPPCWGLCVEEVSESKIFHIRHKHKKPAERYLNAFGTS